MFLAVVFSLSLITGGNIAHAGLLNTVEEGGLGAIGSKAYGSTVNTVLDPRIMIARAINLVLTFVGIIMVALIVYSGWQYMTAQGDKAKLEEAKKRIQNAVVGLIIIISAYALTTFLVECSSAVTDKGMLTNICN